MKVIALCLLTFLILLPIILAVHVWPMTARAPELFGEGRLIVLRIGGQWIGIVNAPGIALSFRGAEDGNRITGEMRQIAGAPVLGEMIDGVYGAGTEKPVQFELTRSGKGWRGWIDFRGHPRPFWMRPQ